MTRRPKDSRRNMAQVEGALERAIERPFARLFRSPLQPAEIEKAAIREVEKKRKLGANTIYVPNVYTVIISEKDEVQLANLLDTLKADLATRLFAYTSNNNYQMTTSRPLVFFNVEESLKLGEVIVIGETLSKETIIKEYGPDALPDAPARRDQRPARSSNSGEWIRAQIPPTPSAPAPAQDPYIKCGAEGAPLENYQPLPRVSTFAETGNFAANPAVATLTGGVASTDSDKTQLMASTPSPFTSAMITVNHQPPFVLGGQRTYTIGRLSDCDILIDDPQASREHAQLVAEGDGWAIADLNSTNGTLLNGEPVTHRRLKNGDVISLGSTVIRYQETGR